MKTCQPVHMKADCRCFHHLHKCFEKHVGPGDALDNLHFGIISWGETGVCFQEHLFPTGNCVSLLMNRTQITTYLLRISVPTTEVICLESHTTCLTKRKVLPVFWIDCTNNLGYLRPVLIWHGLNDQEQKLPINTSNMNRFPVVGLVSSRNVRDNVKIPLFKVRRNPPIQHILPLSQRRKIPQLKSLG